MFLCLLGVVICFQCLLLLNAVYMFLPPGLGAGVKTQTEHTVKVRVKIGLSTDNVPSFVTPPQSINSNSFSCIYVSYMLIVILMHAVCSCVSRVSQWPTSSSRTARASPTHACSQLPVPPRSHNHVTTCMATEYILTSTSHIASTDLLYWCSRETKLVRLIIVY